MSQEQSVGSYTHKNGITKYEGEDTSVNTRFIPCSQCSKWTFEDEKIKTWVETHLEGRVLNACAGKTHLSHDAEIIRNDRNTERDADIHVDVAELSAHFEAPSFDSIVFDPPWSLYQSNLRYDGIHVRNDAADIDLSELPLEIKGGREKSQLGHARLAKEGFNYLLKPGGKVIELSFHGSCMPSRMGYERIERVIFDPLGERRSVIGSVDKKVQTQL